MFCLVQFDRQVESFRTAKSTGNAPEEARKEARKWPQRARKGSRQTPETPTMAQDSSKEPFEASSGPSAREVRPPRRAQETPRRPKTGPKTAPKGPKTRSRSRSEGWKERVKAKKRKSASRLGASTIFEGRAAPKEVPNRPDLGTKSAQKAGRTDDSTSAPENLAGRPEIRPRTADGRLSEGSENAANQIKLEVLGHLFDRTCD